MTARACVVVLCLAGCDRLFGLPHVNPPADVGDMAIDGSGGALQCPATYTFESRVSASRYRYVPSNAAWTSALAACIAEGTHLVVLTDDSERLDLRNLLVLQSITNSYWLGLSDRRTEGVFLWVTDEPVGTPPLTTPPWGDFQPDDNNGNQDCVRSQAATQAQPGYFDDAECAEPYPYVCECDGVAAEPMHY